MPPHEEHTSTESTDEPTAPYSTETTPASAEEPQGTEPLAPKKPQQTQVLMLIGLGVVLAFAAGAYAFGMLDDTGSSDPLAEAVNAWEDVDTFAQDMEFAFSMDTTVPSDGAAEPETTSFEIELDAESRTDRTDRAALKAEATFALDIGVDAGMFAFNEGVEFDFRLDDTTAYVQITKLPAILALFGMGPLRGEWIVTELDNMDALAEAQSTPPLPDTDTLFGRFGFDEGELTEEDARRLAEIAASHRVFSLEETSETTTATDESGTHELTAYTMVLHSDEILSMYDEMVAEVRDKMDEAQLADATETRESLAYLFENLMLHTSRVWMDDVYLVYRVELDMELLADHAELEALMGEGTGENDRGESRIAFTLDLALSDYNVPVSIEFPENARPIEEVFESMGMPTNTPSEEPVFFPESDTPAEVSERAEFLSNMANVLAPFGLR